jgi:hypothetical protein
MGPSGKCILEFHRTFRWLPFSPERPENAHEHLSICRVPLQYTGRSRRPSSVPRRHARKHMARFVADCRSGVEYGPACGGSGSQFAGVHTRVESCGLWPTGCSTRGSTGAAHSAAPVSFRVRCQRHYEDQSLQCTILLSRVRVASLCMSGCWGHCREHVATI